jgi:serine/threonine protein kinase
LQNDATTSSTGKHTYYSTEPQELRTELLSKDLQDATASSAGQHTYYSTAPQEPWTEPLLKGLQDATTSRTGEHTYYSTAPQEFWTELLSKDLQGQNFVSKIQNNEGESSCVEVHLLRQSDLLLSWLLAEGGQAHVYFAECEKFSTPVVVKRLKDGNVDLFGLQRRLQMVMKIRKKNNSAICRVFGVGRDWAGNAWVVMEQMAGDLRTLIERRTKYLEDGQMPFDYNNTITMMMHIAQGMEDLHGCGLIHADLKASNILVTPMTMDPREEEVDGSQQASESMYFYVKIGDFETSDGIVGTRFWRAPEVLQALRDKVKPILSPAADVYSYGMLCYELLTGRIPFEKCDWTDYDVVLLGQRPKLPAHVNLKMKKLLHACWHTELWKRPGWTSIIRTLKEELTLHPLGLQRPKRCKRRVQLRTEMEQEETQAMAMTSGMSNLVATSWEEVITQELGTTFVTWKAKVTPEVLLIMKAILQQQNAIKRDQPGTMICTIPRLGQPPTYEIVSAFNKAWFLVKKSWTNHVGRGFPPGESGTDFIDGLEKETVKEGQIDAKKKTERMITEIWANEALESYNFLGPTTEHWLKEILATSKEWQTFQEILHAWDSGNEGYFQMWKDEMKKAAFAWEEVHDAFQAWHVKSPIGFIAWQALKNMSFSECEVR